MKTGTLAMRLLFILIFLIVLLYFALNIASYFNDPYMTTLAYTYTSDHAVSVSGYVVREEEVLSGSGSYVYASRREGERVSSGGVVAQLYQSAQTLADANTLRNLEEQLAELEKVRSTASSPQSSVNLNQEITRSMTALQSAMAQNNLSATSEAGSSLRSAILGYNYAFDGHEELDSIIASVQSQIETLSLSARSGTTYVTAPRGGLFSSLVDGYETVLTPEALETMNCREYRAIAPQAASGVGRMVYGSTWYFVTLMRETEMNRLAVGDTVTLRFQTGLNRDLAVTAERISDADNGQRVVVFSSENYLPLVTLLRHQNAQVIFQSYTGIRVPRSAVRISWETVKDEDGNPVREEDGTEKREQITAVYCIYGNRSRMKPVHILWQEDEYLLVEPAEGVTETYRLRSGDQVITAAAELYDGKVMEESTTSPLKGLGL